MKTFHIVVSIILFFCLMSCRPSETLKIIYYDGMTTICATLSYSENDCIATIDQAVIDQHFEKFKNSSLSINNGESDYFYEGMSKFLEIKEYSDDVIENIIDDAKMNQYYEQYKNDINP